jgi:hypothetical protein
LGGLKEKQIVKKIEIDSKTEKRVVRASGFRVDNSHSIVGETSRQPRLQHSKLNWEKANGIRY